MWQKHEGSFCCGCCSSLVKSETTQWLCPEEFKFIGEEVEGVGGKGVRDCFFV